MPAQTPYPISGTVTTYRPKGATASYKTGARVWAIDISEGTTPIHIRNVDTEDVKITTTNSTGQYILDLANITDSYSNNDTVEVWVEIEGYYMKGTHVVDIGTGSGTVNFTFYRRSGLKDGLTRTATTTDRPYGLEHLGSGMRVGLKDGLVH